MVVPRYHRCDVVESTNDIAIQLARGSEPEGTIVVANQQTRGKGRRGRQWWDDYGQSLLMSLILTPDIPQSAFPQLSFVASLSVAEYLITHHNLPSRLKWPNDVYVNNKKISGILIEITTRPGGLAAVCGIGLNAAQTSFPPELASFATSVSIETGAHVAVDNVLPCLVGTLLQNYSAYLALGFEEILARWRKYIWGIGCPANIVMDNTTITGTITGVDPNGALVILDADGTEHVICAADAVNLRLDK